MKRLVLILLVLFFVNSVLALETTLKSSYQPGETLIAEISGNFLDNLKAENILFFSGRLFIPMIYDLAKIQDTYYLYAILPVKEKNYSLIIKDAHYTELGTEKRQDLVFNFSVKGNVSSFSVNPGFIITNKDFNLKILANKNINLQTIFLNSSKEVSIKESQEKKVSFSVSSINKFTLTYLTLSSEDKTYEIPVVIYKQGSPENFTLPRELKFSKSEMKFTVLKNQELAFEISLLNTGQEDVTDISLKSSANILKLSEDTIDKLKAGDIRKINLTIESKNSGLVNGTITAIAENLTAETSVSILTLENETEFMNLIENNTGVENAGSCSELNGKICADAEECSTLAKLTLQGFCCTGVCNKKSSGSVNWVLIILILVLLAIIGFFVYKRMKLKRESSEDIIEEKSKDYESRFKPAETRDKLTRI